MPIPDPVPGLVIRYAYLWREERMRQLHEGPKDRPCMVVVAVTREGDSPVVTVAPITSRAPPPHRHAVELSRDAKRRLGLDHTKASWVITDDLNKFVWPGSDIRPIKSGAQTKFAYGLVSRATFYAVRDAVMSHGKEGTLSVGRRT